MHNDILAKSIIITSALPYANGQIHIGHIASTYLPADIFKRYLKHNDISAYHICASDDFGTPILINAEKEGLSPQKYVDHWNKRDQEDFNSVEIEFDKFYKTSSKENFEFVQYVFKKLFDNGYIFNQPVIQFYCDYDDKFLPDRYVKGKCPFCHSDDQYSDLCEQCGRVPDMILEPKCAICGRTPIQKESMHYFFKLSSFSTDLEVWLKDNKNLQNNIKNYVLNWIDNGLKDWDITRDLSWGIPIPIEDAKGKVFYGWFDNHLCYISTFNTLMKEIDNDGKKAWNSSTIYHFIGKDIVYHHYLFLPAIRMGIGQEYKLPDYMPCRGHVFINNKKISKSRNWIISIRDFINNFSADYLRFYLASITPHSQTDINFDIDNFYEKINNELIANIGNFINRTLSLLMKYCNGEVPEIESFKDIDNECIREIENIGNTVGELLVKNEIDKALKSVLQFSTYFNQYFQKQKPWEIKENIPNTLFISSNAVAALAILLDPFIPYFSQRIWEQLGFNSTVRGEKWCTSLKLKSGHKIGNVKPLFKKIEKEEIESFKLQMNQKLV